MILWEMPRGFITDPFSGMERELARENDLELIPDTCIRLFVVRSPAMPLVEQLGYSRLSEDGIHPNAHGNELMATYARDALRNRFGEAIVAQPTRKK